jgi:predicted nuclease of predicted toxin-antitoxin system
MRFTADENLERSITEGLRDMGHDVLEASIEDPGASDPVVLERSRAEGRILITNDKDFAELAFLQRQATVSFWFACRGCGHERRPNASSR